MSRSPGSSGLSLLSVGISDLYPSPAILPSSSDLAICEEMLYGGAGDMRDENCDMGLGSCGGGGGAEFPCEVRAAAVRSTLRRYALRKRKARTPRTSKPPMIDPTAIPAFAPPDRPLPPLPDVESVAVAVAAPDATLEGFPVVVTAYVGKAVGLNEIVPPADVGKLPISPRLDCPLVFSIRTLVKLPSTYQSSATGPKVMHSGTCHNLTHGGLQKDNDGTYSCNSLSRA